MDSARSDPHGPYAAHAPHVSLAETLVGQLHDLLESEFETLKAGSLDTLDTLQNRKLALLEQLAQLAPAPVGADEQADLPPQWRAFAEKAKACRMLHHRNETLVTRQLDAVRGALSALQLSAEGLIDETYDRNGRLAWTAARRRPRNTYQDV